MSHVSHYPTRIDWLPGHGWVVRALDGRILMLPVRSRDEARAAAKRYRQNGDAVDKLRLSNKSIRTKP
jgi:hypothetical protein